MRRFKNPLRYRQREANYRRERYARDPDFRLTLLNRMRLRSGLPTLASVDEIRSHSELASRTARLRERDARGRFL